MLYQYIHFTLFCADLKIKEDESNIIYKMKYTIFKKHYIGQKVCPFHRSINEHLKNKNIRNGITDISEYRQP